MGQKTLMWEFNTQNFSVRWYITECVDPDLSWDKDGFFKESIERGDSVAFDSEVAVFYKGNKIGADYLGESIYEDPEEFRDHIGTKGKGYGSYFSDMVRSAINQARETLSTQQ